MHVLGFFLILLALGSISNQTREQSPIDDGQFEREIEDLRSQVENSSTEQENPCHGVWGLHFRHFRSFKFQDGKIFAYNENGEINTYKGHTSLLDFVQKRRVCQQADGRYIFNETYNAELTKRIESASFK